MADAVEPLTAGPDDVIMDCVQVLLWAHADHILSTQPQTRFSPLGEEGQFLLTTNSEVRTCLDCIYHGFELASKLSTIPPDTD